MRFYTDGQIYHKDFHVAERAVVRGFSYEFECLYVSLSTDSQTEALRCRERKNRCQLMECAEVVLLSGRRGKRVCQIVVSRPFARLELDFLL